MKETPQQPSDELHRAPQSSRAKHIDTRPRALAGIIKLERLSKADVIYVIALTIASLIAYVLTTSVVMVVAGLGPASLAWTIPPLRLLDTVIGIVVGVGGWGIAEALRRFASADD